MIVSFERKFLLFIIIVSMVSFFNKSFAKYEKIFYDFNIKNINGNNLDLDCAGICFGFSEITRFTP